jgi:hypothetical protein
MKLKTINDWRDLLLTFYILRLNASSVYSVSSVVKSFGIYSVGATISSIWTVGRSSTRIWAERP